MTSEEVIVLLPEIKRFLHYDWEDSARDSRLEDTIIDGATFLEGLTPSKSIAWADDKNAKWLLKNFCMYQESHATDEFMVNYEEDIRRWKLDKELIAYEAQE